MLQSSQPYDMVDFSSSFGSIFYSTSDGITNPILPLTFASGQQNIFRQLFQKRADASAGNELKVTERAHLQYLLNIFNLTNTSSFDLPGNKPNCGNL